jgi:hypothetical protein
MATDTVRIKSETRAKLRDIAKSSGKSMPEILDEAVEVLRRTRILEETGRAFEALQANTKAWQEELAERADWESTLGDDLTEP